MNTHKYALMLLLSSLGSAGISHCDSRQKKATKIHTDPFLTMMQSMEKEMEESMERLHTIQEAMHQNMAGNGQGTASVEFNVQEKDKAAVINIKNLETDSVDATVNDEGTNLVIKTAQGVLSITTQDSVMALSWQHKKEEHHKDDKGQTTSTFFSSAQQTFNTGLRRALDLASDKLKIDYNKQDKTLTVHIPFVQEEDRTHSVPVNIREK